ncbi:aBC-type transport system permease component [Firmicutes bacterium CAG:345]|nr:aBC-type transport system permease component [Firmicutes bacterium CAG:345]
MESTNQNINHSIENKIKYTRFKELSLANNVTLSIADSGKTVDTIKRADRIGHIITTTIVYILLIALALIVIFPFYWMIITSLKSNSEVEQINQTFFPSIVMWSNYVYVFDSFDFLKYMKNTIVVAIFSTAGTLITTIFAAFAFARLKFKGREPLFLVFLMTMMIPGEMMVISNYITIAAFGWIGTGQTLTKAYLAMIVPFLVSVFHIYLLRQNFKQIPNELYLAAKVDGKSDWKFLWRVMVPLAAPTLISITILKFMGTWNSYVWPNLVTNSDDFRLISNGLRGSSFTDADIGKTSYGYQMAATVLVTVPLFLLFVFFRKYIMRGVGRAGIKG